MQRLRLVISLAMAAVLAAPGSALAQDTEDLPKAPVPYSKIRPKASPAAKKPAPKAAAPAASAPAAAEQSAVVPTAPAPAPATPPATPMPTPPAAVVAEPAPLAAPAPPAVRGARLTAGQALSPAELQAFVDGWMADAMDRTHVAGAAVSVVQNGQVVLNKGYGFADARTRRLVNPDRTLFRVGSISKTFTWILLMKEVEAGRIRLDQPINLYLPEKVKVRDDGYRRDILVRNLMDHSPGFEDRALGQLFERDADKVRPLQLYLRQERPKRVRGAGVLSSYSNYGVALAGEAVAFVSGKTFERRVEEEILIPLGMRHTTFREPRPDRRGLPAAMPQALRGDISTGYRWDGTDFDPRPYEYIGQIAPAIGGSSTAGDMTRYMLALLGDGTWNGATIYGPRAARAFRTPIQLTPPAMNGWAHGFMTYALPGGYAGYGHGGDTVSFHSNMILVPALKLGIFVTTNSDSGGEIASDLPERLMRHFYAEPLDFPRKGRPELAQMASAYDGAYLTTRRPAGGLEGFIFLFSGGVTAKVTSDGRLLTKGFRATQAWTPEGDPADGRFIGTAGDGRLMARLQDGRAASLRTGINAAGLERAPWHRRVSTLALLAGLTGAAALATLGGLIVRNRRDFRQNPMQGRAGLLQNIQAGLWLTSLGLFGAWATRAGDQGAILFGWPGPLIVTASTCALVAAVLNFLALAALPAVWQGGRRVDSWPGLRKLFFSLTAIIYLVFSMVLWLDGALAPWSG